MNEASEIASLQPDILKYNRIYYTKMRNAKRLEHKINSVFFQLQHHF